MEIPAAIQPYVGLIKGILLAVAILVGGWIAASWVAGTMRRGLGKRKMDATLVRFLSQLVRYAILAATVIAALQRVGVQTASLVAVFASAGLAVGLALQGSLSNFAAGVMVLIFRPFSVDDVVTAGGHTGRVEEIGLFVTTLITPDNETIFVPNSKVTGDSIVNLTRRGIRRGAVSVGVAYGTDVNEARAVLLEAVKKTPLVLADPEPAVPLTGLGASSVDFTILAWANAADYLGMLANVRQAAYDALNAAGIEIPFNQIVVHQAAA